MIHSAMPTVTLVVKYCFATRILKSWDEQTHGPYDHV